MLSGQELIIDRTTLQRGTKKGKEINQVSVCVYMRVREGRKAHILLYIIIQGAIRTRRTRKRTRLVEIHVRPTTGDPNTESLHCK